MTKRHHAISTSRRWATYGVLVVLSGCSKQEAPKPIARVDQINTTAPALDRGVVDVQLDRLSNDYKANEGKSHRGPKFYKLAKRVQGRVFRDHANLTRGHLVQLFDEPDKVISGGTDRALVYRFKLPSDEDMVLIVVSQDGLVRSFGWNSYKAVFPSEQ